jgi:tRNA A-37 threonylcarbamoyl transferase component Bud32
MDALPAGYVQVQRPRAELVTLASLATALGEVLAETTLYAWAASHPERRVYAGRLPAYAVPLPDGGPWVVARHSHHGGWLAGLTRDLFLPPTRAPRELAACRRLLEAGIATPEVVAYAIYPAGPFLRRGDVLTLEIAGSEDLGAALLRAPSPAARQSLIEATATLLRALAEAGVRHPDLNVKNILFATGGDGARRTYLLDVDSVDFGAAGGFEIAAANLARLLRSLRKWRRRQGVDLEAELSALQELAGGEVRS